MADFFLSSLATALAPIRLLVSIDMTSGWALLLLPALVRILLGSSMVVMVVFSAAVLGWGVRKAMALVVLSLVAVSGGLVALGSRGYRCLVLAVGVVVPLAVVGPSPRD